MLYVVYIEDIKTITVWNKKPEGHNILENLNCFSNEPLIYHIGSREENYGKWLDFFFPISKYGNLSHNMMRTISQELFDRFIAGEYDKVKEKVDKKRAITVVFEKSRDTEKWGLKEYSYYCDDPAIEVGDIIDPPTYNNRVKVVRIGQTERTDLKTIEINKVYKKVETKENSEVMKKNTMVQGMIDKMKSRFIPQKEEGVKLSMDGVLCVQVNDEYVGIDKEGNLVSYPDEMCIDVPVYSIAKATKDIKEGDIIKRKNTYAKVLSINSNGSLRCLTYSGCISNKKEIKDFVLNESVERVLINMFNFDNNSGFNPMIFALAEDNSGFDLKSFMMMQMMQNQNGGTSNMFNGMNPMMLMMLSKDGNSANMTDMLLMSMCMGNNPFTAIS